MTRQYIDNLEKDIKQNMNVLYDGPFQRDIKKSPGSHFDIMTSADIIFFNISEGTNAMDRIRDIVDDPNNRIDLRYVPFYAKSVERYRWPVTIALQGTKAVLIFRSLDRWALFCILRFFFYRRVHIVLLPIVCRRHCAFEVRVDSL